MKLPRMIRNIWIYRSVIALAVLLGIICGFVLSNREEVDVRFPFIGTVRSWAGVLILVSAALGSAATWVIMTFRSTLVRARQEKQRQEQEAVPEGGSRERRADAPGSEHEAVQ